jgi:hypothetical protein
MRHVERHERKEERTAVSAAERSSQLIRRRNVMREFYATSVDVIELARRLVHHEAMDTEGQWTTQPKTSRAGAKTRWVCY